MIIFGIHGLVANTYPFTGIQDYFSASWTGLMLYLVNLAYVVLGSLVVVVVYRGVRGLLTEFATRRELKSRSDRTLPTDKPR